MKRRTITIPAVIAAMLVLPATAGAHVTLQPNTATPGSFTRLNVRVPNEERSRATTKVEVQMPPGFAGVSYEAVPGWRTSLAMRRLATPIKTDDGNVTEEVARITFTATGKGLEPGQFQDFGLSVAIPDRAAGTKLTFKALQTYSGNEVVRWIGAPGSEHPAPQVTLTPASDVGKAAAATPVAAAATTGDGQDKDSDTLPIIALIAGGLGLLAGGAALVRARG